MLIRQRFIQPAIAKLLTSDYIQRGIPSNLLGPPEQVALIRVVFIYMLPYLHKNFLQSIGRQRLIPWYQKRPISAPISYLPSIPHVHA